MQKTILAVCIVVLLKLSATAQLFPGVEIKDPRVIETAIKQVTLSQFIFEGTVIDRSITKILMTKTSIPLTQFKFIKYSKGKTN